MSTSYEILLDAPLSLPEKEAEAILREALSHMPANPGGGGRHCSVSDDLHVVPPSVAEGTHEVGADGLSFTDGRVRMCISLLNIHNPVGGTWLDGVEHDIDDRIRIDVLFDAFDRICAVEPGAVIGTYWDEHQADAAPIISTALGVRHAYSSGDRDEIEHSKRTGEPIPPAITSLHPDLVIIGGSRTCQVDRIMLRRVTGGDPVDALRAHAELEELSRSTMGEYE